MSMTIPIGKKSVGDGCPIFIIAEAGVNHNGSFELAKKLVDTAKDAGADAIKFQTFKSENVTSKRTRIPEYAKKNMGKDESMIDMIKKLELSYDLFIALKSYCDEKDIMFLSAPHSDDAIDFLEPLMPAYKIASGDLVNIPLLEKIAKKNMPVILSTGMATIEEVEEGITAIRKYGNMQIIVLQCTTNYPAKLNETNLRAMQSMKNRFNVLVGYSDHTLGLEASKVAVELGAVVIEKHFTLDKSLPGPDHKASMNPAELRELVECIKSRRLDVDEKIREEILGSCEKKPSETELKNIPIVRKSLIAKKDIAKGSLITEDMIIVKRPGIGIKPRDYRKVIGMKARLDIGADDIISWSQLE